MTAVIKMKDIKIALNIGKKTKAGLPRFWTK